ncbi:uncharacterized protein LOC127618435 [Xyrauchen texanus]|uniref:uncharacterized protein LOC127618435 n=1 Tax=Xyrauchen texanus TaxID=154827 RepID=UPI0022427D74|nr:uncharacterized protein LOC127618435 [Xyrauchen texanus]
MVSDLPKVLILGAIAAASAFVVTILIVLVCVGCQRKSKSKHAHTNGGGQKTETAALRQSKLNSMSKSDTRLHDMNRLPCNANGAPKSRPASMDLLLLHTRHSNSDLRPLSSTCQVPQVSNTSENDEREHTYSEVCRRPSPMPNPTDDGLYESVGIKGAGPDAAPPPPAPHLTSTITSVQHHNHSPTLSGNGRGRGGINGISQEAVTAEYASIGKVKKLERGRREEVVEDEREQHSVSSTESSSSTLHRKTVEPFHLPNFPKEAVFMGNGEQYIWKPPEEDEIMMPGVPPLENGHSHPTTVEISDMYSTVCKTLKRRHQKAQSQEDNRPTGSTASEVVEQGSGGAVDWPAGGASGEEAWGKSCSQEEPCYEPVGEKTWPRGLALESDPAYATIDSHRKREKLASNTLKPKKKPGGPPQGPGRAMTCENFYESIGDVKQGANAASTTTIFTFNDGMEMYVTGL